MKAPILTDEELRKAVGKFYGGGSSGLTRAAIAQRDADHLHYMGVVREIFEAIERGFGVDGNDYLSVTSFLDSDWYAQLKSRFLEGDETKSER